MLKYLTLTITGASVLLNVTIAEGKIYRTYSPERMAYDNLVKAKPVEGIAEKSLYQKLEAIKLASKVAKLKDKYYLEYENDADLLETCEIIVQHENVSPNFNKYDVAAIIIKESKFYRKALNKRDGGKGLTMAMPKFWKEELPWYRNPYNKAEAIRACYEILKILHGRYKTKSLALKRYNGSTHRSTLYAKDVQRIGKELAIV